MSEVCTRCRKDRVDFNKYRCNSCYAKELHDDEMKAIEEVRSLESVIQYYERPDFTCLLSRFRLKVASAKIRRLIAESLALEAHVKGGVR